MQFRSSGSESFSPEQRTAQFFSQDPFALAQKLVENQGMVIEENVTGKKVRITKVEAFLKNSVGKRYRAMNEMQPGDLWNPPQRQIRQSLVVAKDADGVGACVRLTEARYLDPKTNQFVKELFTEDHKFGPKEGDIAKYFGLNKNDQSKLRFLDESDTLFIVL